MQHCKLFVFILLSVFFESCGDGEKGSKILFSIDTSSLKQNYTLAESIDLNIKNEESKPIDSVIYFLNDKKVANSLKNEKIKLSLNKEKLGKTNVKAIVYFEGKNEETSTSFEILAASEPKLLDYTVLNTYKHDGTAYTQGFEFYNGILMEGTGQYGTSSLRKTNYKTGEVSEKIMLDAPYFGEGITILNDVLYQLTWQEKIAFVYDAKTLEKKKTFTYNTQGWGLTNDGTHLYMSDGSHMIYKLNPATFEVLDTIQVYTNTQKIEAINELEWIDGKIWANIYEMDSIIIIDPKTGTIENILNMTALKSKVTKPLESGEVLNGIAYNPTTKTVFVTGKNWDKVFEISLKK